MEDDLLASLSNRYEVVYPVQIRGSLEMPDLNTRDHRTRHHKVLLLASCLSVQLVLGPVLKNKNKITFFRVLCRTETTVYYWFSDGFCVIKFGMKLH